jgi:hypothetical protein
VLPHDKNWAQLVIGSCLFICLTVHNVEQISQSGVLIKDQ